MAGEPGRRVEDLEAICVQNGRDAADAIRARNDAERECKALRAELADTKAMLARGVEFVEADAQLRALLTGLAMRMRECRPLRSQDSGYVIPQSLVEDWADEIDTLLKASE